MSTCRTIAALAITSLVAACAGMQPSAPPVEAAQTDPHAGHRSGATPPTAGTQDRMKAMHEMRDKMRDAKTPQERHALMADHMKAMRDGMQMMKGMGATGEAKGMHADMGKHKQSMEARLDMMQTMLEMMLQRLPDPAAPPPVVK